MPVACEKNAAQFTDYLRFLAYTGAREQEALKVRWDDVDIAGERVTIGTGGVSKNHEARSVEFNDKLGALLRDMGKRRAPDCSWLFPSPQRGPRDEHARTFRESLLLTRKADKHAPQQNAPGTLREFAETWAGPSSKHPPNVT